MTTQILVGQAAVQVRAVGTQFTSDINRVVTPGLSSVARQTEGVAYRGTRAFGNMWSAFNSASQGALGPVDQIVTNIQMAAQRLERGSSMFAKGSLAGVAGLGIGAGLQVFASKEQAAKQQLEATLATLGLSYDQFGSRVEGAVHRGEHFGKQSYETIDALNRLTMASGSPKRAIEAYDLVLNMSATRHIDLSAAVQSLVTAFAGNTRMFKQYGINITDQTKAVKAAASADTAHKTAIEKLKVAKQNLTDQETRISYARTHGASSASTLASAEASLASAQSSAATARFSHGDASPQYAAALARVHASEVRLNEARQKSGQQAGLTASQQIALRKANEAVAAAQKNVTKTANDQTSAHAAAKGAAHGLDDAIKQLSDRLDGQAQAAANTFTGRLKAIAAHIEDDVAAIGAKYGPAITAVSTGVLAASTLAEAGMAIFSRFSAGGRAAIAANKVFAEATAVEVDAAATSTEATLASMQAEALLAESDVALAGESAATATAGAWTAAEAEISGGMAAMATEADAEFVGMGVAGRGAAAASSAGWVGALSKAGIAVAAFAASYSATMMILNNTPVGGAVRRFADTVGGWLGQMPDENSTSNLGPATRNVVAFAASRGETVDQLLHDKKGLKELRRNQKLIDSHQLTLKDILKPPEHHRDHQQKNLADLLDTGLPTKHGHHNGGNDSGFGLGDFGLSPSMTRAGGPYYDGGSSRADGRVVSELHAGRMDSLQQTAVLHRLLIAVQDLPAGMSHEHHRHRREWSSPELLSGF